jgi:hypothetical protein
MLAATAGLLTLLRLTAPSDGASPATCRNAPACNVSGTRAMAAGQMAAADAAFDAELRFAFCEGEDAGRVLAYNNLAVLALRRGLPLEARLWADRALKLDPRSTAAAYNARRADERAAGLPAGHGLTGTYKSAAAGPLINEVWVQELSPNRLRFAVWADAAFSCADMGNHVGGASGEIVLTGQDAVWESREFGDVCRLHFSFGTDALTVTQEGSPEDCGFGQRVYADGAYRRTDRQPPHFTAAPAE